REMEPTLRWLAPRLQPQSAGNTPSAEQTERLLVQGAGGCPEGTQVYWKRGVRVNGCRCLHGGLWTHEAGGLPRLQIPTSQPANWASAPQSHSTCYGEGLPYVSQEEQESTVCGEGLSSGLPFVRKASQQLKLKWFFPDLPMAPPGSLERCFPLLC
ncbi:Hypothetical predicted protein, partial [Marmota monax]